MVLALTSEELQRIIICCFTQYLGSTGVTKTHGAGSTDDAVKHIIHQVNPCVCIVMITSLGVVVIDIKMLPNNYLITC